MYHKDTLNTLIGHFDKKESAIFHDFSLNLLFLRNTADGVPRYFAFEQLSKKNYLIIKKF